MKTKKKYSLETFKLDITALFNEAIDFIKKDIESLRNDLNTLREVQRNESNANTTILKSNKNKRKSNGSNDPDIWVQSELPTSFEDD